MHRRQPSGSSAHSADAARNAQRAEQSSLGSREERLEAHAVVMLVKPVFGEWTESMAMRAPEEEVRTFSSACASSGPSLVPTQAGAEKPSTPKGQGIPACVEPPKVGRAKRIRPSPPRLHARESAMARLPREQLAYR